MIKKTDFFGDVQKYDVYETRMIKKKKGVYSQTKIS